ncbi:hypothetical protein B9Z19DRAFT_1138803 [Tuber borchii]|uniref:Uncharacterized protein n=1 Tax=Tuber borchii TaxID=42251 RepID=A0A2T6Z9N2_TUBBO|nr:hypothetical protein B9Z19DRAFT_1138803 [Tuber borchii]
MDYPKASMLTPAGHLKAPPYISQEGNKAFKLPDPSSADILPLNFTLSLCRQEEQGRKRLCDYKLQQRLSSQLKLSTKMKREAEAAQTNGQSTFKHIFGNNCNTVEVFFQIDYYGERAPLTSRKATLKNTQALGSIMFGAGLKLNYGDKIREYVEKTMSWNIEEDALVNPPAIPKDTQHKDYEEWLLANLHPCWPPWARTGLYYWGIWMEQVI